MSGHLGGFTLDAPKEVLKRLRLYRYRQCSPSSHVVVRRQRRGATPPRSVTYAATATATLICLGLTSSRSGSRTVSTPALYSALTLPGSTVGGSADDRTNEP